MFTHDPLPLYSQSIWSTRQIAVKTAAAVPNGRGCISGVSSGAGARRRMRQRTTRFARVGGSSAFYCTAALAHLLPTVASCACLYCSLRLRLRSALPLGTAPRRAASGPGWGDGAALRSHRWHQQVQSAARWRVSAGSRPALLICLPTFTASGPGAGVWSGSVGGWRSSIAQRL